MNKEFNTKYNEKAKLLPKIKYDRNHFIKNRVVFYGTGRQAQIAAPISIFSCGINIVAFADSFKTGTIEFDHQSGRRDFPIISVKDLTDEEYSDCLIVICVMEPDVIKEIYQTLLSAGIPEERIFDYYSFKKARALNFNNINEDLNINAFSAAWVIFQNDETSKQTILSLALLRNGYNAEILHERHSKQYFDFLDFTESEIFVDGGFFNGDTFNNFLKRVNNKFKKYYGFELDKNNLFNFNNDDKRIEVIPKGLWSSSTTLSFHNNLGASCRIGDKGNSIANVTDLDSFFVDKPESEQPTIIKMDIEGAEKEALLGAKNIIGKFKPKLAICVYHKIKDIYEIPLLVKELNPDYKMTLRHYSCDTTETVLYAY